MREEAFSYFTNGGLVAAGLIIFLICFVIIVLWTFRKSGRKFYEKMARLPLDERYPNE